MERSFRVNGGQEAEWNSWVIDGFVALVKDAGRWREILDVLVAADTAAGAETGQLTVFGSLLGTHMG